MVPSFKNFGFAVLLTVLGAFPANAQNATMWKIDKAHSSVNFSVNHFFTSVIGKFTQFDGNIFFDTANLKSSKADFTVVVNSINTDETKRDNDLKSPDFFDANTYPNMTFKSTKIEKNDKNEYKVYGKLTIKDKTKDIVLPLKVLGEMEHPMMKGTILMSVTSHIKINRNDFGVGTGMWATNMVVGDEVDVTINMELDRMK